VSYSLNLWNLRNLRMRIKRGGEGPRPYTVVGGGSASALHFATHETSVGHGLYPCRLNHIRFAFFSGGGIPRPCIPYRVIGCGNSLPIESGCRQSGRWRRKFPPYRLCYHGTYTGAQTPIPLYPHRRRNTPLRRYSRSR